MTIKVYNVHDIEAVTYPGEAMPDAEGNKTIGVVLWELVPASSCDAFAAFVAEQVGADAGQVERAIEKWYEQYNPVVRF